MKKIQFAIMVILVAIVALTGCNRKQKKELVIGVSMLSLQAEFVVNVKDVMEASAKEKNIQLIVTDAQLTAEKQVQQIETFISQKVDAIILNPCEVEASSPAIDKAKAAGIPIVNVNSETKSAADAFVGSRDEESGEIAMEQLAKLINYRGNIVILDGNMGQAAQIKRSAGAMKVLAKYPLIKLIAEQSALWDRAKAMTVMENWIQSYGSKINGVFAQNDEMGMGALQALEQVKLKPTVALVSVDAIADALQAVKAGRLNATVYQDAKGQGEGAIDVALKLIKKEPIGKKETFIPFKLVTIENVNEFLKK